MTGFNTPAAAQPPTLWSERALYAIDWEARVAPFRPLMDALVDAQLRLCRRLPSTRSNTTTRTNAVLLARASRRRARCCTRSGLP